MFNAPTACSLRRRLAGAAVAIAALAAPAQAEQVGTASAVNLNSLRTPPGASARVIELGAQIVRNEKIETSKSGSVQLLFIDKTALSIGPNSKIIIDKFVFNPVTTEGEVALNLTKGVLRVVGGMATHSGGGTIATPVATVGIRGGIVTVSHSKEKGTQAILGFGVMTVTSGCMVGTAASGCTPQTVTVRRPGFAVQVASADAAPTQPARAGEGEISESNRLLSSKPGQTGGSPTAPTDPLAVRYNIGTANSTAAPVAAVQNQARGGSYKAVLAATRQVALQGVQNTAAATTAAMTPSPTPTTTPTPTPTPTSAPTVAYSLLTQGPYSTSAGSSPAPYLTGSFAGQGAFTVSPILGYAAGGLNPDGTKNVSSRQFQAGLSVTGQGASQTSALFVMTSMINKAPNIGFTQAGGFNGQMRGATGWGSVAGDVGSATLAATPNSVPTDANGVPNGGYSLNNVSINLDTGTVSAPSNGSDFNPVSASAPTVASSVNHPNLTLAGYVGGLTLSVYFNPSNSSAPAGAPYIVTNATGKPGDVSIYLPGGSSQMGATFNVASVNAPANGYTTSSYQFGSYSPSDPNNIQGRNEARGAYIDPSDFAGRATTIFANGANTPTSSRNGLVLSGPSDNFGGLLVTANSVGANSAPFLTSISPTTVQPCACEFTQWGFWSASTSQSLDKGASTYSEIPQLPSFWVAGVPTTAANIPTVGTATYTGHAVADISNNGAQYLAAGTFANIVNFGTRTGAVTIGGLDGTNYTGKIGLLPSSTLFAGGLTGSVGGRLATLNGSFFQGGATNTTPLYGEMGGSLTITGTNYLGSGVFLGRKP